VTGPARTFAASAHLSGLLSLTGRLAQERIGRQLAALGLSYARAAALVRLWRHDGPMPQTDMIRSLALSRASGTLVLNQLAQQGLIERQPVRGDARRVVLELTPAGRDLEGPVLEIIERVESTLRARLTDEEVETAFRVLVSVLETLRSEREI